MMMKGPFRELIPIGPQQVTVRLPSGAAARRVRLLTADTSPTVKREGQELRIIVPSTLDHEIVAIDL